MFDSIISPAALRRDTRPIKAVAGLANLPARAVPMVPVPGLHRARMAHAGVAAVAALLAAAPAAATPDPRYTVSRSTAYSVLNAASGSQSVYDQRYDSGAAALLPSASYVSPSYLGGFGISTVDQLAFRNRGEIGRAHV